MSAGDAAAHALHHAFDIGGVNQVVDADFVLEGTQEAVQAVKPVLAGACPELANLDDDFLFHVAAGVVRVFQPVLGAVKVVGALER